MEELAAQCARSLRNLSCSRMLFNIKIFILFYFNLIIIIYLLAANKIALNRTDAAIHLESLTNSSNDRVSQQVF
jgi:hypothetical protein